MKTKNLKRQPQTPIGGSLKPVVGTPICNKAKLEVLHCSNEGSGYLYAVPIDTARMIEREKAFYRHLLEQVAQDSRKTRARRLAESGLMFWDALQEERTRRANTKLSGGGAAGQPTNRSGIPTSAEVIGSGHDNAATHKGTFNKWRGNHLHGRLH